MDGHEKQPVRLRVFRDEVQDLIPLDFELFFAENRGRDDDKAVDALGDDAPTTVAVPHDD
jgi:hypothetical protein